MEFRCKSCGHVGAPSGVTPGLEGGIVMVCAQCGVENGVELTEQKPVDRAPAKAIEPVPAVKSAAALSADELRTTAFERLVPEPGDGFRCPKCIRLIDANDEHCQYCGLEIEVGVKHDRDNGPWEKAPVGKEDVFEQAKLLWSSADDDPTSESFKKFVDFTDEHELWDLQIRRIRWFLVDHPDNPIGISLLEKAAEAFQARVAIAQATSKARARDFEDTTQKFRHYMMIATAIFWFVLVIVVGAFFVKSW